MSEPLLPDWSSVPKPVIGMVHLLPLPGSPRFGGHIRPVADAALRDAESLVRGGVHGLLLENFGDGPFAGGRVPAYVVAHMTRIAAELRKRFDIPLGINVLRNDARSALAIAAAVGADFIRVNVLCGARVTDQGIIQGNAYALLRDRVILAAQEIRIFADVNVKHSSPLGPGRPVAEQVTDLVTRGGADALIVSGVATGEAADADELRLVRESAALTPVLIGSGVTPDNIDCYAPQADGFIVGTSLKQGGLPTNRIDPARVQLLMERVRATVAV